MRLAIVICAAGLVLAAAPQAAAADGGPMPAVQGWPLSAPGSPSTRYVALGVRHGTLVERLDRHGYVQLWRIIPGHYGVAAAASDGSTTGLSADRRTLVLPQYTTNYPPKMTRFVVLDPHRLRVIRHFTLPGFFTVDAISPAGDWLYLIHYLSATNTLRYEVRAYDMPHDRLLAKPVIDPREPDEKMVGIATTRLYSPGGRWAYTLYQRPNGAPFVHALDTANRTAACIDLPNAGTGAQMQFSLGPGGRTLRYGVGGKLLALIDTQTFKVTRPAAHRPAAARPSPPPKDPGGGVPAWLTAVVALAAVAGLAGIAGVRRRRATYAG
jgi:hypothetical protein